MHLRSKTLGVLCLLELAILVAASPHRDHAHAEAAGDDTVETSHIHSTPAALASGTHSHMHGGIPKTGLNETELLIKKGPSPLSYRELDSGLGEELFETYGSHYGTMVAHGFFMTLAFALALPLFIFFKAAKHAFLAGISQATFLVTLALGMVTGLSYSASTPDLYKSQKHGSFGWLIFTLAVGLSFAQILRAAAILFMNRDKGVAFSIRIKHLLQSGALSSNTQSSDGQYELVGHETSDEDDRRPSHDQSMLERTLPEPADLDQAFIAQQQYKPQEQHERFEPTKTYNPQFWRRPHRQEISLDLQRHEGRGSLLQNFRNNSNGGDSSRTVSSDETLHESLGGENLVLSPDTMLGHSSHADSDGLYTSGVIKQASSKSRLSRATVITGILKYGEILLWRVMVLLGWTAFLTGCITYWGGCRSPYVNACLAHEIKGSIFFWYGVLTFGRYCGSWAELGWAWNRKPGVRGTWREHWPSAEMVESFVIWLYGASNTWLERFGAGPDDPWTLHQVQHVSIAVMFFFAGSAGMILESKTCRDRISGAILTRTGKDRATRPPSYSGSFNIFPALTIGITGLAMSAHHQEYVFSASIHALWGTLLAGFAVCRILTYTFLHLRPPASILPSRPPTEALAAFCLCSGGIVFMLSTEEVIFWAMRHGFDDMMTFLNATVAFVCAVLSWVLVLMALKGWATRRSIPARQLHQENSAQPHESQKLSPSV